VFLGSQSFTTDSLGAATISTILSASVPVGRLVGVVGGSAGSMVVPAPVSPQTGTYFWVQVKGNVPNVATVATTSVHLPLYSSATTAGAVTITAGGVGTTYSVTGLVMTVATGSAAGPNAAIANWPAIGVAA
jgi:hypothetical protein